MNPLTKPLYRTVAFGSVAVAVVAISAFTLRLDLEDAAQELPSFRTSNDSKSLNARSVARERSFSSLRDKVMAKVDRHAKFSDLEEELRVLAAPDASSSDKISLLRLLAKSELELLEFEKVVDLFCLLDTDTEFSLSAVELLSASFKKSEITRRIFSKADENDLPVLADSLSRVHNDRERQILVRQLVRSVLQKSSPSALYQWITENLDQEELPEATGTLFSAYAEMLSHNQNFKKIDFESLTEQFPQDVLQPVAISGVRILAARGDVAPALSILYKYPPSSQVAILEDALSGMGSISKEAARVFEIAVDGLPEGNRPSLLKRIHNLSN